MYNPKVSVIVPTFNRGECLKKCILSILNQTYNNIEIIVIDDGSMDNTRNVIHKINTDYNVDVKYYYKDNGGVSSARNYGIKVATGDYIAFLDSDDEWILNKLEKQIKKINETNTKVCYCGTTEKFRNITVEIKNKFREGALLEDIIKYNVNAETITWVIERKLITDNNIYFEENCCFAEDLEFLLKVCSVAECSCVKEYLAIYNKHELSLSTNIDNHIQEIDVFERLKKWIDSKLLDKHYCTEISALIDQYRIPIILINYIFKLKSRKKECSYLNVKYKSQISNFNIKFSNRKVRDYLFYKSIYNKNIFAILNFIKSIK